MVSTLFHLATMQHNTYLHHIYNATVSCLTEFILPAITRNSL